MKSLTIRVENEEHQQIVAAAAKLGISVSAFMRLLAKNWYDGIRFERDTEHPGAELSTDTPQTTKPPSDSAPPV